MLEKKSITFGLIGGSGGRGEERGRGEYQQNETSVS